MMYIKFEIWRKIGTDAAIRYQGVRTFDGNKYSVVNGYRFYDPVDARYVTDSNHLFVELLTGFITEGGFLWSDSLEEALADYDKQFSISE